MDIIHALLLGIVEGVTEFLPISSTGHLILTSYLLGLQESDFLKSFEIIIQLGAIAAVVCLYWRKLFLNGETFKKVALAFVPTAVIGLALYTLIKKYLLGNVSVVLWAFFIGGAFILIFEYLYKKKGGHFVATLEGVTYKQAVVVGIAQAVAIVPGVSRSAATIVGGLMVGIDRKTIVEFSFLLAIPTMIAATGLDLFKNAGSFSAEQFSLLAVGFVTAFIFALLAVKFLLRYISHHTFSAFGVYRIIVAILFWFLVVS